MESNTEYLRITPENQSLYTIDGILDLRSCSDALKITATKCNLTEPPLFPEGVIAIDISTNSIKGVITIPDSCRIFKCMFNNSITGIVVTENNNLRILNIRNNSFERLPNCLKKLTDLDCRLNDMVELPTDMPELYNLLCCYNQITTIPTTLVSLQRLWCQHNNIVSIPDTLINLQDLWCSDNKYLTSIPLSIVKQCRAFACKSSPPIIWMQHDNGFELYDIKKSYANYRRLTIHVLSGCSVFPLINKNCILTVRFYDDSRIIETDADAPRMVGQIVTGRFIFNANNYKSLCIKTPKQKCNTNCCIIQYNFKTNISIS